LTAARAGRYNEAFQYLLLTCPEERSLILLAFLIPVGIYCLVLSVIHRGHHPVMVSGPWDFVGVLFAASGILLLGGPAILAGLYEHWRLSWLLGQTRYLQSVGENWSFWISLWLLYFGVVLGGSAFILWRRRGLISIYNVEPAAFAEVLIQVLDRLRLEWRRNGPYRLVIRFRQFPVESAQGGSTSACPWVELALEAFPAMHHVTLHWLGQDDATRLEVESELAKTLPRMRTRPNLVGICFLCLALVLLFAGFFVFMVLFVTRLLELLR
jgi:hypothetical protein